jgi:PAS domain S-box-containing protein
VTDPQIRAEILLSLAELYEDSVTRNQYKSFRFQGTDNRLAQRVLAGLKSHQVVMENGVNAARLTDVGYKLIRDELARLRSHGPTSASESAEKDFVTPLPPKAEEIRRVYEEMGHVDFIVTSRLTDGRFVTRWASPGFEEITGYTVQELEDAGGWPVLVKDLLKRENSREVVAKAVARVLAGERLRGEIYIRTKKGASRWLQCTTLPRWDSTGTRVIGSITAVRDITRDKIQDR